MLGLGIGRWLIADGGARIGIRQAGDGEIGDERGDLVRRLRAFGTEPVCGPVERAKERARRDGRVGSGQRSTTNAAGDEGADATLVPIPFGDDARAEARGEGVDFEVRGRPLDLVEQAEDVGDGQVAQPIGHRPAVASRRREGREEAAERPVLTEKEELVLAPEVVVQVARREVRGDGDVAHARRGEPAIAEEAGCSLEDTDASRVSPL
jgi:hypothetical protein